MITLGSSPRLWGTQGGDLVEGITERFIPTPVGNTRWRRRERQNRTVHPHACGEHRHAFDGPLQFNGSSPRLWGTPEEAAAEIEKQRFIPTPVGNTTPCIAAPG